MNYSKTIRNLTLKNIIFLTLSIVSFLISEEVKNINFIQKTDNVYELRFNQNDIEIESKEEYSQIKISQKTGTTGVIGMPKLPSYSTLVMVNPEKDYRVEYNVEDSYVINDVKIIPNQQLQNGLEKETISSIDQNFYSSNKQYPYEYITISEPMIMRDLVLLNLTVVPFNYSPDKNQLEVYTSMNIRIIEEGNHEDIRSRDLPKSRVFENLYKNKIVNYSQQQRDDEYQDPAILYICSGSIEDNASFQQLVEWRRQRGYIVYTASLSETGSSSSSIKNYIQNAYNNFNPAPEYVALIGDVGGSYDIPTYYEDFGHDSYGNLCEGDHPYSQLDGNDLFPEILIGRMSIRTTSEIAAVVPKIINYEKATYLGNLDDYFDRAAMAGDPSSSGNSCAITKEYVKEILEAHGFNDVDIKTSGSSWASWMQNELSDGVLFLNYRGYLGMSGFSTSDVDNANNGYKLPFATVLTCGTGSFAEDQTAMSEKFFRAGTATNPKGAVASIGTATWNTHTLFNNIVDMGIYDGLLADNVGTAGAALASGKLALYNTYSNDPYEWINAFTHWNNLMGDPATHLWTDTPEVLDVSHLNELSLGTNFFDVVVQDESGMPVAGALVSIEERNLPTNVYTDSNGLARIFPETTTSGNTLITITKQNCKPYQGYINITNENYNINLDSSSNIIFNDDNNNLPESGEEIGLSIPLKNFGSQSVSGISATITSSSNHVLISNGTVSYGTIQANSNAYGDDFILSILPTAIEGEDLQIMIDIYDNQSNQWSSLVLFDVLGSYLVPVNTITIQPGQTSSFDIDLRNLGTNTSNNVTAELSYSGNLINVNDATGSWGSIFSGQTSQSSNGFNVTLSSDIINGSIYTLDLHIQSADGYDRVETVSLQAGTVSSSDPLGPDNYGYYIYDSSDDEYSLAPSYDWIEIDGSGTNLNLDNDGDGNWGGNGPLAHIDLPFDFSFYGIEYDEITICTNGWISLGYSTIESFRNYPIPGAGGPSPMIAAFWDDLETGNNGDVFYQEFNGYVVIEWSDMRTQNNNSLETFQIILYDNAAQPYGDNEIKIQYKEFNNTSSGSFSSYPPIHGGYATIGIENHLADDGLQYTFLNQYPSAAATLGDNTALYITTQPSITLPSPELTYSADNLNFELDFGDSQASSLIISNTGEQGSELTYSVSSAYPEMDSPFDVSGGGPDAYGFYWTDSNLSSDVGYNWIDISNDNNQVNFSTNDDGTSMIDIGFDFSFYGQVYSEFLINPNGWIGFEEDSDSWYNGDIPSPTDLQGDPAPMSAIFGFWDDLNPVNDNCNASCSGNVYYQSSSDRLVVWFDNVYHWASEGYENSYYDFQIVIYPNGEININHRNIEGAYSATVGIQNSTGTIATQVDEYIGDYFSNDVSYKFIRPYIPDWLSISSNDGLNGTLLDGDFAEVIIEANALNAQAGEYLASIIIISNASNFEIPVSLYVGDLGMIGDLNSDELINVSDIVILVSIILNNESYTYNADINQDGTIDVLDVVMLVGYILND